MREQNALRERDLQDDAVRIAEIAVAVVQPGGKRRAQVSGQFDVFRCAEGAETFA